MAVTEIALLKLLPSTTIRDPDLLSRLSKAKQTLEKASGHPFVFLSQREDPSFIYIIGTWSSVSYHQETFLPSPENQEILALVKGIVDVEWMFHLSHDGFQGSGASETMGRVVENRSALRLGRYFVPSLEA